jgi:hypothetical protein
LNFPVYFRSEEKIRYSTKERHRTFNLTRSAG